MRKKERLPLAKVNDISDANEVADMVEKVLFDNSFRNNVIDSGYKNS